MKITMINPRNNINTAINSKELTQGTKVNSKELTLGKTINIKELAQRRII